MVWPSKWKWYQVFATYRDVQNLESEYIFSWLQLFLTQVHQCQIDYAWISTCSDHMQEWSAYCNGDRWSFGLLVKIELLKFFRQESKNSFALNLLKCKALLEQQSLPNVVGILIAQV